MNTNDEKLIELLKTWQKLEDAAVHSTTEIIKSTRNPFVQVIMEIIRQDSVMHRRVQQLILDSLTIKEFSIDANELDELWAKIEEHDEMERKVVGLAEVAKAETESPLVKYLLDYLLTDERKHDLLLSELEKFKNS